MSHYQTTPAMIPAKLLGNWDPVCKRDPATYGVLISQVRLHGSRGGSDGELVGAGDTLGMAGETMAAVVSNVWCLL